MFGMRNHPKKYIEACRARVDLDLAEDTTIKYDQAKAVLKYKVGDLIQLKEADFLLLSKAYFAEIKNKFA
jgi:hypothetical protein